MNSNNSDQVYTIQAELGDDLQGRLSMPTTTPQQDLHRDRRDSRLANVIGYAVAPGKNRTLLNCIDASITS